MKNINKKKPRARSKAQKANNFQQILEVGKDLFVDSGPDALTMRKLAKHLNMTQTFLYTYVQSKRELWIAIRKKYFNNYSINFDRIVKKHKGTMVDLLMKLVEHFLNYANEDFNRFQIMFIIPIPFSKKIGPIEKKYQQSGFLEKLKDIIKTAMEAKEIKERNLFEFTYLLWSLVFGIATTEIYFKFKSPLLEKMKKHPASFTKESYRECSLKEIRNLLGK